MQLIKALKTYFALSIVFTFQNIVLAAVPYTAKNSTEAVLTFSHRVELISDVSPSKAAATDHINYQLQHMFGPMSVAETAAVPKEDYEIQITRIQLKEEYENVFEIFYDYKGTIVLASGPQKNYSFLLPVNPALIYEAGMQRNAKINRCTDEHYQNEDDFWYFWNPYQENCSLVEGEDFDVVNGTIERLPNTDRTYPEYDRLADENGVITIDEYFGLGDETTDPANVNPYESQDVDAPNYTATAHNLRAMGFESRVLKKKTSLILLVLLTEKCHTLRS